MQQLKPQQTKAVTLTDATDVELAAKHQARQEAVLVLALSLLLAGMSFLKAQIHAT